MPPKNGKRFLIRLIFFVGFAILGVIKSKYYNRVRNGRGQTGGPTAAEGSGIPLFANFFIIRRAQSRAGKIHKKERNGKCLST